MIRISLSFPSLALLRPAQIHIGLPGRIKNKPPHRVVWALHCAVKDGALFFDELGAGELVDVENVAIVAPSLGNGYYVNSVFEAQADFLDEIRHALPETLPLSRERADNAVLGISMGGFGAMRWGLQSGAFSHAASISGVFDSFIKPDGRILKNRAQMALHATFDKKMRRLLLDETGATRPEANLEALLRGAGANAPEMRLYCGSQDYLALPHNREFMGLCEKTKARAVLRESSGGHDVEYWRGAFHEAYKNIFS